MSARLRRLGVAVALVVPATLAAVPMAPAGATWRVTGDGGGKAAATTLAVPAAPTATCEGAILGLVLPNAVRVTWSAPSTAGGKQAPTHYEVEHLDHDTGSLLGVLSSTLSSTTRQFDLDVGILNPGTYRFRVVAIRGNWRSPSPPSRAVSTTLLVCGLI
jgi:hypothetical protein